MNKVFLFSIFLLQVIILVCIGYGFFVKAPPIKEPENRYYATTEDGRLFNVPKTLNLPTVKEDEVLYIIPMILEESFTLNHSNHRKKLQILSQFFTRTGWESWTQLFQRNNLGQIVANDKSALVESIVSEPEVISSELRVGRYSWDILLPIKVKLKSSESIEFNYKLKVTVVRVTRLEAFKGIGIENVEIVYD